MQDRGCAQTAVWAENRPAIGRLDVVCRGQLLVAFRARASLRHPSLKNRGDCSNKKGEPLEGARLFLIHAGRGSRSLLLEAAGAAKALFELVDTTASFDVFLFASVERVAS